jgi:hypothetical protein
MAFFDPVKKHLEGLGALRPARLKKLANVRVLELIDREAVRSRRRVDELRTSYPSADIRELAQRLIDHKKQLASMLGGISGVFGAATVPLDLVGMAYLQLSLLVDVATVFKKDVRTELEKQELLDLFGYANGVGPVRRSSPRVLSTLAALLLKKGGLQTLGRAMPLVAAPISAYLNNAHIQQVGDTAVRHFDGWAKAAAKARKT